MEFADILVILMLDETYVALYVYLGRRVLGKDPFVILLLLPGSLLAIRHNLLVLGTVRAGVLRPRAICIRRGNVYDQVADLGLVKEFTPAEKG